jgi:hypothetical protein
LEPPVPLARHNGFRVRGAGQQALPSAAKEPQICRSYVNYLTNRHQRQPGESRHLGTKRAPNWPGGTSAATVHPGGTALCRPPGRVRYPAPANHLVTLSIPLPSHFDETASRERLPQPLRVQLFQLPQHKQPVFANQHPIETDLSTTPLRSLDQDQVPMERRPVAVILGICVSLAPSSCQPLPIPPV